MSNNPLKQYFRRPSIYITLPSEGKYYDEDTLDKSPTNEYAVYPMSAIDEVTAKTPDALFNGSAVIDIIHSCIPNIKNAWNLNTIDLDAIMIAIRVASVGEEMDIDSECPNCQEVTKYSINLVALLSEQRTVNYDELLIIGELKIKFRPLTYFEANKNNLAQYELQKTLLLIEQSEDSEEKKEIVKSSMEKINELTINILSNSIEYILTPETSVVNKEHIKEFLLNCSRLENNMIREQSTSLREKNQIKPVSLQCPACKHQYNHRIVLNVTDFFD
jgi:hypothetical protein